MNLRKNGYVLAWLILIVTVFAVWVINSFQSKNETPSKIESSTSSSSAPEMLETKAAANGELIGLWVPYMSLSTEEKSEEAFKNNYKAIVDSAKEKGINALFVHVRPFSDALYKSDLYPWSHILTGQQGVDPGYDPMKFMIEYAHQNGMKFHAWLNPLRVKTAETPAELSSDNVYTELNGEYPYYFMEYAGGVYLNPAYSYVRSLISDGAAEIVRKYDVDGIHFDDYFYPAQDESLDETAYAYYKETTENPLSLSQWRTGNVNAMVSEVYSKIKKENPDAVFGISPQGNISNDEKMNADVKTWCAVKGYIDYICPQIYYSYENPALGYSQALDEWLALEMHDELEIYIGLALYKAGSDADEGTWQQSDDIISRQIKESRERNCNGIVLYSSDYLNIEQTEKEVENAMTTLKGG